MKTFDVLKRPLITEKGSNAQAEFNQYAFAVDPRATKYDVRNAVEEIFNVKVEAVRTMSCSGKYRRVGRNVGKTASWKKAIVTLGEGDRIDLLEGA